jgi:hypothetical protein
MLDLHEQVHAAARVLRSGAALKAVLSGLMALFLVVAGACSVNDSLHQSLHSNSFDNHFCLVCSLAKGQAAGPEAPLIWAVGILLLIFFTRVVTEFALPDAFDYSVSSERAPPVH